MFLPCTETEDRSPVSLGEPSEILRPRIGIVPQRNTDSLVGGDSFHESNGFGVVDGDRKMISPGMRELEAVGSGDLLSLVHQCLLQLFENILSIRPQRSHHFRLTGSGSKSRLPDSGVNDRESGDAVTLAHGIRQCGQILNQLRHRRRRTPSLLWIRSVRGRASKTEDRSHRPGGKRSAPDLNFTKGLSWKVVERKDPIRGDRLKSFVIENAQRARTRLLGRLEEQNDSTTKWGATVQLSGQPGDDGHMPVVPARVGDPRPARAMSDIVALLDGHRVDLGTKHDRWAFFTTLEDRRQSGTSKIGHEIIRIMWLDERPQDPTGFGLLGRKLGMGVKLAPKSNQRGRFGYACHRPQCTPPQQRG